MIQSRDPSTTVYSLDEPKTNKRKLAFSQSMDKIIMANKDPKEVQLFQGKIKLKDILKQGGLEQSTHYFLSKKSSLTAQQKAQFGRIKQNEQQFAQLSDTLNTRKMTFAKFAFRSIELEEHQYLKPIIKGIYEKEKSGTMLVTELWTKDQMRGFLSTSDLSQPKRVLKRFAHWEWDQNNRSEKLKDIQDKLKIDVFNRKTEIQIKMKSEQRLKQEIRRKWIDDNSDLKAQFSEYKNNMMGERKVTQFAGGIVSFKPIPKKERYSELPQVSISKINGDSVQQLKNILTDLNELQDSNAKEHSQLKKTISILQQHIYRSEKYKAKRDSLPF